MTILLVHLFLPHTINFHVSTAATSHEPSPHRDYPATVDYFGDAVKHVGSAEKSAIMPAAKTPGPVPEDDDFFLGEPSAALRAALSDTIKAIVPNEPHSPAWGRSALKQPKSHAVGTPAPSVIAHTTRPRIDSDVDSGPAAPAAAETKIDFGDKEFEARIQSAEWSVQPAEQGNGGLRNAVHASFPHIGSHVWIGTLGMPCDALSEDRRNEISGKLEHEHDCVCLFPSDSDIDGHYDKFCKIILWPILHSQVPDSPRHYAYLDRSWIYYANLNQAFASVVVQAYKRGDVIWIHDYHLMLAPAMIRKKLAEAQIGFFMHVAFPSSEVFRCLARRVELLEGMLGANLIGFQTQEYCSHFLQTCNRLLFAQAKPDGIQLEDRFVRVERFPIGIDTGLLSARRDTPEVQEWVRRIKVKYSGKQLIVARDKLDDIRGVREKLLAFELLLKNYPQYRQDVVLIQVATQMPDHQEVDNRVSEIATRINSTYSTLDHQPLVFLRQDLEYSQYLAMAMAADAFMITSLREGMNLTSHEYVFLQDGKYGDPKHGTLILSEFTGSSTVFEGAEVSVNPYHYRQCADAIKYALEANAEERFQRWQKLMKTVEHHSAINWCNGFLERLDSVWQEHVNSDRTAIPRLSSSELAVKYKDARRRVFILDYEDTLSQSGLLTNPQRSIDTLSDVLLDRKNIVYVMSSRRPNVLERLFSRVPSLGLIAESGGFVKEFGKEDWIEIADVEKMREWKEHVKKTLEYYTERMEGSWVEERYCSLVLHTSKIKDEKVAERLLGECCSHINESCGSQSVHALQIRGGLLVKSNAWSKGMAAVQIFEGIQMSSEETGGPRPDFLMVVGDSREDEELYRWANKLGETGEVKEVTTVSLSSNNSEAKATLTQGVTGVMSVLRRLTSTAGTT